MRRLKDGRRAIEPTSIDKITTKEKFSIDPDVEFIRAEMDSTDWNPNSYMRSLGFMRNPENCIHYRKRFKTRWICSECGANLL